MKEELLTIIHKIIRNIISGYKVVHTSVDDYDEYGAIYLVYCKNGYETYDYHLNSEISRKIINRINSIIVNGINFKKQKYYLDPKLLSEIYIKPFKRIELDSIKILSVDERLDFISYMGVLENIREFTMDYIKKNINCYRCSYPSKNDINITSCQNFKSSVVQVIIKSRLSLKLFYNELPKDYKIVLNV